MRLSFTLPLLLTAVVSAHKLSLKRIKHHDQSMKPRSAYPVDISDPDSGFSLGTINDLLYIVNITVGGHDYSVQLDTGSSDLWIKGDVSPLPDTTPTSTGYNITYVLGWAFGHVSFGSVEFLDIQVPKQAFLDVTDARNPVLGYNLQGIVGLGFTSLSSIDYAVNKTNSDQGRSLLYNLFAAHPLEPNFLAFALHRSSEEDDEVEGSFTIGEYEPEYASVANTTEIPTWPLHSPKRWTVLLDALIVNSTITVPTSIVDGAPSNKAVVWMDSGSSYTYVPKDIVDQIYGNITGAKFNEVDGHWIIPCGHEINMALQIGGMVFPLHPLDVAFESRSPTNNTICLGSFVSSTLKPQSQFDWLIGDNFLRAVYAVYDFGDYDESGAMGDPYMKMLALINPDEASIDFHNKRGGTPRTNITYVGLEGEANAPSFFLSEDVSETLDMLKRFIPAMLAVVALNALLLVGLAICGVTWWLRRRRSRTTRMRNPRGRMTPMPLSTVPSYIAGQDSSPSTNPTYQPVSMAITDDGQSRISGPLISPSRGTYQPILSMAMTDDGFLPPAPAFHRSEVGPGDRPKSIA